MDSGYSRRRRCRAECPLRGLWADRQGIQDQRAHRGRSLRYHRRRPHPSCRSCFDMIEKAIRSAHWQIKPSRELRAGASAANKDPKLQCSLFESRIDLGWIEVTTCPAVVQVYQFIHRSTPICRKHSRCVWSRCNSEGPQTSGMLVQGYTKRRPSKCASGSPFRICISSLDCISPPSRHPSRCLSRHAANVSFALVP
jgi:hypothetical protein